MNRHSPPRLTNESQNESTKHTIAQPTKVNMRESQRNQKVLVALQWGSTEDEQTRRTMPRYDAVYKGK